MRESKKPTKPIKSPTCLAKFFALISIGLLGGCEAILCSTMINCFDPLGRAPYSPNIAYFELKTPSHMDAHIHWLEIDLGNKRQTNIDFIIEEHVADKLANGWSPPAPLQKSPDFPKYHGVSKVPVKITVTWTSLPENTAYRSIIPIHWFIHKEIVKEVETPCMRNEEPIRSKRNVITLELAPGGKIKSWLSGFCLDAKEVAMKNGITISKKERSEYSNRALINYSSAPMDNYIKTHGIPYESW